MRKILNMETTAVFILHRDGIQLFTNHPISINKIFWIKCRNFLKNLPQNIGDANNVKCIFFN